MPVQSDITKEMEWFANCDIHLVFPIFEEDDETPIAEDMSGWACAWMFKQRISDADEDALVTKSGGSVFLGTDPVSGNPAWFVQIEAEDTQAIEFTGATSILSGRHELKRTDTSLATVLSYGKAKLRRPVHAT
jgi:hypothetical protein